MSSTPIKHLVVPILGVILLIPAFLGVLGGLTIPILDIDLDPLAQPYDIVPLLVAGLDGPRRRRATSCVRSRNSEALDRVGDVMTEAADRRLSRRSTAGSAP